MASKREYAYYIKGNKIAIIERGTGSGLCSLSGYSNQTTCEAAGGTWTENAVSRDDGEWLSPIVAVTDGLEIQYTYSPNYFITSTNNVHTSLTNYKSASSGGYLKVKGGSVNYDTTLDVGDYVVLRNAGQFNGLHKVTAFEDAAATKDSIVFDTKYSGSSSWSTFEETVTLYYSVSALVDESSEIDLPRYQSAAIVYYLKAKIAEGMGDMEQREYFMREFKRQLEKSTSALKRGPYMIQGFKEMR